MRDLTKVWFVSAKTEHRNPRGVRHRIMGSREYSLEDVRVEAGFGSGSHFDYDLPHVFLRHQVLVRLPRFLEGEGPVDDGL